MDYFNIILVLVVVALGFLAWSLYKQKQEVENEVVALDKEKQEAEGIGKGLAGYHEELQERKEQVKQKILQMLLEKEKLSNSEIALALKISSRTTVRYLDELEKQGEARQVGKTGKSVFYSK